MKQLTSLTARYLCTLIAIHIPTHNTSTKEFEKCHSENKINRNDLIYNRNKTQKQNNKNCNNIYCVLKFDSNQ